MNLEKLIMNKDSFVHFSFLFTLTLFLPLFSLYYIIMKVLYPKNIKKGLLAGMTFNIWPLNIWILQLFLMAVGIGLALVSFNALSKNWSKAIWILVAIVIVGIFAIIAFFKISELGLLAFLSKIIRNNFFDVKKKFQNNYNKENKTDILLKEAKEKSKKSDVIIKAKKRSFDSSKVDDIEKGGFI